MITDYRAGASLASISREHGIPKGSIVALLARHGVERDRRNRPKPSADVVVQMYVKERLSMREIAADLGTSANVVREVLDPRGVEVRPSGRHSKGWSLDEAGDE
ncbi:hypothetical protein [Saccharothrix sp. ST-888]|uniref:hypothetical protein n=1 Tax=Saccharothrix sp. ST-888 TaxID=1427391 RepID=UPI0005ED2640|nr:hypothetical protein [Saccharothrix sp. ST-888]